jgi:gamma-glutamyltranspeptidase
VRRLQPIYGREFAISCGHPAATIAARDILAAGGNIVDAAVASATCLAVVLPQACSLGGDVFVLFHDAKIKKTYGLNGSGRSPALTDASAFERGVPERGVLSCAVPGAVGGWEALHKRFGKLSWQLVLARAIELAEAGFSVSPGLAQAAAFYRPMLEQDPGATELILKRCTHAGALLKQPELARTLRDLADTGADGFYRGKAAASVASYLEARGGWLRANDFAQYEPTWVDPAVVSYNSLEVQVMPPNTYGIYMLLQLAALREGQLVNSKPYSAQRYGTLIAAAQASFAAGKRYVADPRMARPFAELFTQSSTEQLRSAVKGAISHLPSNKGGTAVVSIADAEGNAVCVVQSVFLAFGSGIADPQSGLVMNNRMLGFSNEAGDPNTVSAGKQPSHTLNPVLVTDGSGAIRYVLATPGGPGQTLTLTQILQAMTDHGLTLQDAIALPRWSVDLAGSLIVEPDMPDDTLTQLEKYGFIVRRAAANSLFFGSAECVERRPDGGLVAVADNRREAYALAL